MQLVVVGFHRSGTSLLTQLLHSAGLFVGDDLLGARPSNPYGHFEDREVLELHRRILTDHGTNWQVDGPQLFHLDAVHWARMQALVARRDTSHRNWGFKDPRVCLFLGPWKHVMPDARFVMVYRDPAECVRSMQTRQAGDHFEQSGNSDHHLRFFREPDHGLALWDTHNRAMVAFARTHARDCLVVPFTHLQDGYPIVAAINRRFGGSLDEVPTEAVFDAGVATTRNSPQWSHDPGLAGRIHTTWDNLEDLTVRTEPA